MPATLAIPSAWQQTVKEIHPTWRSFVLAIVIASSASILTGITWPYHPYSRFIFCYPACAWVSIRLGSMPGMVASLVCFVGAALFFVPPLGKDYTLSLTTESTGAILIFLALSLYINQVAYRLRLRTFVAETHLAEVHETKEVLEKELNDCKAREALKLAEQRETRIIIASQEKLDHAIQNLQHLLEEGRRGDG